MDTCKVNGLDDFLTGISPIMEVDSVHDDEEEDDI